VLQPIISPRCRSRGCKAKMRFREGAENLVCRWRLSLICPTGSHKTFAASLFNKLNLRTTAKEELNLHKNLILKLNLNLNLNHNEYQKTPKYRQTWSTLNTLPTSSRLPPLYQTLPFQQQLHPMWLLSQVLSPICQHGRKLMRLAIRHYAYADIGGRYLFMMFVVLMFQESFVFVFHSWTW